MKGSGSSMGWKSLGGNWEETLGPLRAFPSRRKRRVGKESYMGGGKSTIISCLLMRSSDLGVEVQYCFISGRSSEVYKRCEDFCATYAAQISG